MDENKILKIEKTLSTEFFVISSQYLIGLYKNKQYSRINSINSRLFPEKKSLQNTPRNQKQVFYTLIKIFHPDSYSAHLRRIKKAIDVCDSKTMDFYFRLISIQTNSSVNKRIEPIVKHNEWYEFEDADSESHLYSEGELNETEIEINIIIILSHMYLGNSSGYLEPEDLKQIVGDLSLNECNISDLEGLQYCSNITKLDLSNNRIENIFEIQSLEHLEELDLSYNQICDIDPLIGLDIPKLIKVYHMVA